VATIMIAVFCNLAPHALVNSIVFGIACSYKKEGGGAQSSVSNYLPDCIP
jgi:hypothetical protein